MNKRSDRWSPAAWAVAVWFGLGCVANAEAGWTIRHFEIVQGEPGSIVDSLIEGLGLGGVDADVIETLETYLGEVAIEYERLGFRQPRIDDTIQGGFAYKIFVYDYGDGLPPAAYSVSRRYIRVDRSRLMKGQSIDPEIYRHLAHELFHAVQAAYPLFHDHSDLGDWIVEGTADAVGIDTAFKLRKVEPDNSQIRWGLRSYLSVLRIADDDAARKNEAYWTSSLWRYVGEHQAARRTGGRAGTKAQRSDYSFLRALFERNLKGAADSATELEWLDEGLHDITGLGLERIYPNFVSTFVGYVPARAGTPEDAEVWREVLFDHCPKLVLSLGQRQVRVARGLKRVSAGCFELTLDLHGPADVAIHAEGFDREGLEALSIGTANGTEVAPSRILESPQGSGHYLGYWLFRVPHAVPQIFVVSNVAPNAAETRNRTVKLHLGLSSWQSNLMNPAPQPQPAAGGKKATATGQAIPAAATPEPQAAIEALSPYVAMGATTNRRPDFGSCTDPFVFLHCGPLNTIDFALFPGSYGSLDHVTGTGGTLGQLMATLGGIAETGPLEMHKEMREAAQRAGNQDGSEVHIIIPLIDYGFKGTFNNASLTVSRAHQGVYEAVGPQDVIPGPDVGFPLAGRVTIEEYSPLILRGTFSGGLVDMAQVGDLASADPTLPIHHQIQGDFNIVAPWRGDRRTVTVQPSDNPGEAQQDLREAFPFLGNGTDDPLSSTGGVQGAQGKPVSGGGAASCDCSCNYADTADPVCESFCRATFLACAGEKYQPPEGPAGEVAEEKRQIADLRQRYVQGLERMFPGEAMAEVRQGLLDSFDSQPTLEQKMLYFTSFGGGP